ncbi:metalloregulator ArsR/SmtB family transcription factor [Rhizobium sp. XQZ8]|nr:metalloregulator ArsR/SmtB family transcription factor [Rhizobium populisoli]
MGFDVAKAARLLHALSNPVRFQIVSLLRRHDLDVGTLAESVGLAQSPTSQHLRILRDCEVVTTRRDAQRVLYSLLDPGAAQIVETLSAALGMPQPWGTSAKRS